MNSLYRFDNFFLKLSNLCAPKDITKSIVKWLVDVYDETRETVAIATILTIVKKRNQE